MTALPLVMRICPESLWLPGLFPSELVCWNIQYGCEFWMSQLELREKIPHRFESEELFPVFWFLKAMHDMRSFLEPDIKKDFFMF